MAFETYAAALKEMAAVVGAEYVITEESALRAAETCTFRTLRTIPAIVRPASRLELQECLRIACRYKVSVYPVSSGKNWGYGSRVPTADGCLLLDLGRMNRILDFSEDLAYVTVEPGVTQAQLYAFLEQRKSRLWIDATGASPGCSLIGNAADRGFGHTPYADHFANCCGLEIVLATGDVIETGFSRFAGANAANTYRWGVGPSMDGLFSQSNFGIITRMTIWLMPAPEYFQAYYFLCDEEHGLQGLIDALRPLRLSGTIRGASHIANDYKVLSALQQYPWKEMDGRTPLAGPIMHRFRRQLKIGTWNGSGALYGTKGQVKEGRRLLRRALQGKVDKLQFLDDRMLRLASAFAAPYQFVTGLNLSRILALLRPLYGLMKGIPTEHPLASTYWRKRTPVPKSMDPDRDGCGLLWCSPVLPLDGGQAQFLTALASELVLGDGFEPAISLTMITERSLACVISIGYDREVAGEDERAMACHQRLLRTMAGHGYHPYRLGVASMSAAESSDAYTDLLRTMKGLLDPAGILAPGRYVGRPARSDVPARTRKELMQSAPQPPEFACQPEA